MEAGFVRDAAMTAAIFGFFASVWFGWAQDEPPASWRRGLLVGSIASVLTAVSGGVLAWRHWSDGTIFDDSTGRRFGIVVGIEVVAAVVGVVWLMRTHRRELVPVWVALVVGVHLFPVAAILRYPLLHIVAVLVTLVALTAVPVASPRTWPVSAVVGALTGLVLLCGALVSLASALF